MKNNYKYIIDWMYSNRPVRTRSTGSILEALYLLLIYDPSCYYTTKRIEVRR